MTKVTYAFKNSNLLQAANAVTELPAKHQHIKYVKEYQSSCQRKWAVFEQSYDNNFNYIPVLLAV